MGVCFGGGVCDFTYVSGPYSKDMGYTSPSVNEHSVYGMMLL